MLDSKNEARTKQVVDRFVPSTGFYDHHIML
jgi:hypothetical protein